MKNYETFDLWLKAQPPAWQKLIRIVRKFIKEDFSQLEETLKWTNGCWLHKGKPTIYLHTEPDHIQVGFFAGARLKDPEGRLEGNGKFIRFVRVRDKSELDLSYLAKLIRQAMRLMN